MKIPPVKCLYHNHKMQHTKQLCVCVNATCVQHILMCNKSI